MKFRLNCRLNLLFVVTIAAIGQIASVGAVNAETMPIERLVSQTKLASSILEPKSLALAKPLGTRIAESSDLPTAKDLLARRKPRKPLVRKKPAQKPAATTEPNSTSPQTQTPATPTTPATGIEKQVLVSDIIIRSPKGTLDPALESKIRQALTVKTGQPTNRAQLEQNLNAVRALGAFSAVEIIPEDTTKGVKLRDRKSVV